MDIKLNLTIKDGIVTCRNTYLTPLFKCTIEMSRKGQYMGFKSSNGIEIVSYISPMIFSPTELYLLGSGQLDKEHRFNRNFYNNENAESFCGLLFCAIEECSKNKDKWRLYTCGQKPIYIP